MQDQVSGAAGNSFGRETAPPIAKAIGAKMLGPASNEALLNGRRVVIKSARLTTPGVGVTYLMLKRLELIIGAFERDDGAFDVISLPAEVFRVRMRETRSQGASAGKVGIVPKKVFFAEGKAFAIVQVNQRGR